MDENLAWTGLRRYHIEKNVYQFDLVGELKTGRFIVKNSKLQRWKKDRWIDVSMDELIEKYSFEYIKNGNEHQFSLKLPQGKFRMTLSSKINGLVQYYPFEVDVDSSWPEAPPASLKRYLCDHCFDIGAGFNYLTMTHTPNSNLDLMNYAAFAAPAIDFNYRKKLARYTALRWQLAYHVGTDLTPDSVTLDNKAMATSTFALAYEKVGTPNGRFFSADYSSGMDYGVNAYQFPIVRSQPNGNTDYTIQSFQVQSLSLGGFWGLKIGESEFISRMNFQLPVAASGITFKQGMSFDGALMILRGPQKDYLTSSAKSPARGSYWGYQWGGQYHTYKYSLKEEGLEDVNYSFFISKMELFWGYAF